MKLAGVSIVSPPDKLVYKSGESFDPSGMVVNATYTNGASLEITGYTYSPQVLTDGVTEVTVSYAEGRTVKTAAQPITVLPVLAGLEVRLPPDKTEYRYLERFDPAGMEVDAVYSDGARRAVTGYTYPTAAFAVLGAQEVALHYAEDGRTAEASVPVTVSPAVLEVPAQAGALTYTGSAQSPVWNGYDSAKMTIGGDTDGTNAGTYHAQFALAYGYEWADGTKNPKAVPWTIARAVIAQVPVQSDTLTYNGNPQSPTLSGYDPAKMTLGGTTSATDAGEYTASVTPTANYQWADGSTGAKTVTWRIAGVTVAVPTQSGALNYYPPLPHVQSPSWNGYDTEKMTIGGTTSAKDAGNYEAIFTLKPNYQWPDGTTDPKAVVWVIGKAEPMIKPHPSSLSLTSSSPTGRINIGMMLFSGEISALSSNTAVATVSDMTMDSDDIYFFTVTGKANGTATITVTSEEENNYFARSWTVEVTVSFGPVAKLEPTAGVTYTNGISSLTNEKLNEYAHAISDNASITNETSVVYVDDESNHYKISIGDSIAVHAEYYSLADMLIKVDSNMRILGFNHDDLADKSAYGAITTTGKAGFTFRIPTNLGPWPMSGDGSSSDVATNVGNWEKSQIKTYVFKYLKTSFDSVKKTVKKKTSKGGQSTEIITTEDGAFILSVVEAYGSTQNYAVDGEGTQYAWFKAGNPKPDGGWSRSPYKSNSTDFCYFSFLTIGSRPTVVEYDASTARKNFCAVLCI
ncbi:hypothetical protein D7X33_17650 [Butyricicoccus sp. 1XD8-22]|nr:hypothetical protein D7X33_17650 [Butyricicoccus sp. 1XD8-22]